MPKAEQYNVEFLKNPKNRFYFTVFRLMSFEWAGKYRPGKLPESLSVFVCESLAQKNMSELRKAFNLWKSLIKGKFTVVDKTDPVPAILRKSRGKK